MLNTVELYIKSNAEALSYGHFGMKRSPDPFWISNAPMGALTNRYTHRYRIPDRTDFLILTTDEGGKKCSFISEVI